MSGMYILGASGHGKVVLGALRSAHISALGFYDDAPELSGTSVSGVPVLGNLADFGHVEEPWAIVAIGNCACRRRVAEMYPDVAWHSVTHVAAWVDPSAQIGVGALICAGSVIQPDVRVGGHSIINTGATVDHDCRIGSFVHVCPGVHLGGNVMLGDGSWVGIGSQVIQGITIGTNVTVGAGSTVIRDIPDNAVVMGTPARIVRYASC